MGEHSDDAMAEIENPFKVESMDPCEITLESFIHPILQI